MYNDCVDNCSTVAENPETVKDTIKNLNEQLIAIHGMATAIYTDVGGSNSRLRVSPYMIAMGGQCRRRSRAWL